ncbi:MAG: fatty acid synthase subunit beta domain-containing protein, partial [Mycobacteriaceae bacterium]
MTIDEHGSMADGISASSVDDNSSTAQNRVNSYFLTHPESATSQFTLADRLISGEPFAVAFGGQGAAWLTSLEELIGAAALEHELAELVEESMRMLVPVENQLALVRPTGFDPISWALSLSLDDQAPQLSELTSAAVSLPGVLLTQIAAMRALRVQGLDLFADTPVAVCGHSQGILAVESLLAGGRKDVELLALASLIGAAATLISRRRNLIAVGEQSPMVSVSNVDPSRIALVLKDFIVGLDSALAPSISIKNGRRSVVISGPAAQLMRFEQFCMKIADSEVAERKSKQRGGAIFSPKFEPLSVEVGFHHHALSEAVDLVVQWSQSVGIEGKWARNLASSVLVDELDWVQEIDDVVATGAHWILDLGPGDMLTRMTSPIVRGLGIGLVPASTRGGHRNLFTPGAAPEPALAWSAFAPKIIQLPQGRIVLETSFTRLTGRSPILLAGMTPTTVEAKIVAAAANAGHWAELAGGGQVTEQIFSDRVAELNSLLEPGRAVQFNSLFLDPYLWKLQLGGKRLVQKARAAGAAFDGVVVTAGIPELDDAISLIEELAEVGISYIAFKPGTVEQIRAVIRIAAEMPGHPIIVHIEGGHAGGHHSWEDLDDLLVATYAELRSRSNLVICVGGGIGTPERAAQYLTGKWSLIHGYPEMPVDGILVGTAAMATAEAATSPQVKQLLVDTVGSKEWIGSGKSQGGMTSGRSQLGADIHEIDNAASRCGRLLDEVAGDAGAVQERREEIIAALAGTAKPYFGDVDSMTYQQWLERYLLLAVGEQAGGVDQLNHAVKYGDSSGMTASVWLDRSWRDRFADMLQRAEARLHPQDRGPISSLFSDPVTLEQPQAAIALLLNCFPDAAITLLHPADISFFTTLCKSSGKPVNFVPVIDADVRRWWRSDSLWQAHDSRYSADQVCVIPGTASVTGIDRIDEPVGELLDRFEQAAVTELLNSGLEPLEMVSRLRARADVSGLLGVVLSAPDVQWAGRLTVNPVVRLGGRSLWQVTDERNAVHLTSGARLVVAENRAGATGQVDLEVQLSGINITIKYLLPESVGTGGVPIISMSDAGMAMQGLLAVAAGSNLPTVTKNTAEIVVSWDANLIADHAGVTAATLPVPLAVGKKPIPDVLVGASWPAVFAVIGASTTAEGQPVIEGLLDLVHLDHSIKIVGELPISSENLVIRATAGDVFDSEIGRIVPVTVEVITEQGRAVARLNERFAIRGRMGTVELPDPPQAGMALSSHVADVTRRRRRQATIIAPQSMHAFAMVSGDHNPIHTDKTAALLAGLDEPIVHGMWISAAAQQVVTAVEARGKAQSGARRLRSWTARFLTMVRTGAKIDVRVDRIGHDEGAEVVEVQCRVDGDLVMVASGLLDPPKTVYAFPGQGIQHKGMGLDSRSKSKAAREIWDRADKHTRSALDFSILAVVRDNPTTLKAQGVQYHHPDGVLFLTQFTQVAMATLAVAQVAELREIGAFVEDNITCGHSVGEYNALAAVVGVLPLEAVLEVVFQRGSAMHALVPRDELGRSNYRLAAIRPSQLEIDDDSVAEFISEVATKSEEFLEIVNYNLRGSQYAIAGTVRGLEHLEHEVTRRLAITGGKRAFILIPGIDVPFHSSVLRKGVPEFRNRLENLLPREIDPALLIGRYIPNLVPRLFSLDRDFIQEICDLVPSEPLKIVLENYDQWLEDKSGELTRVVLTELLAWQFASPVRWIETQDLLFADEFSGGLGVERFIEVGVSSAPTVAGLAANTLKLPSFQSVSVEVLNVERDAAAIHGTDSDPDLELEETAGSVDTTVSEMASALEVTSVPLATVTGGPRPADISFDAADATKALIALWTKLRTDQIQAADSIESLCDGVSSRRNQLLVDLGTELSLGAIDGAADADIASLSKQVAKLARTYRAFGPVLTDAINDQLRKAFGPSGRRLGAISERIIKVWELGEGWVDHVVLEVALGTRDGVSVRGGTLGNLCEGAFSSGAEVDAAIDAALATVAARQGVTVSMPSSAAAGTGTVDLAALHEFTDQLVGRDGVLVSAARLILTQLGHAEISELATDAAATANEEILDLVSAELGPEWPRLVAPAFDAKKAVLLDDRWASAREDLARLWLESEDSIDEHWQEYAQRFTAIGVTVGTQASWWQAKALAGGRHVHASLYARIAELAQAVDGGVWSEEIAVVTGASKGSIAAAVTARLLSGGATVIVTTSQLDDSRMQFYRELYRTNASCNACLWIVPANMASYRDIDSLIEWVGSEQSESMGGQKTISKQAMTPTLLFPFAAPRVMGDLSDAGSRAEMEMKILLWAVQRLIGGLSAIGKDTDLGASLHVVLPGSPNRGMFGGDGAYGEAKSALDSVVARWKSEKSWAARVTLVHALIGWTRGTGLMGHNDPIVDAVEEAGVRTFSTEEMAAELLLWCESESRVLAATEPLLADLTGGLAGIKLDLADLASQVRAHAEGVKEAIHEGDSTEIIAALPAPPGIVGGNLTPQWPDLEIDPAELVVVVGAGELGPYGSARTRFEMEVDDCLSAAGVVELAWSMGLVAWENDPTPGWYDADSGDFVPESEIADKYHDTVIERCGIRRYCEDGALSADNTAPLLASVFLDQDLTFIVNSEAQARSFLSVDPEKTRIAALPDSSDWQVTRMVGTEIRVPRKMSLTRTVGGQIPSGFDPTKWGISADMASSVDRVALWNLVTTVDAFISSGFTPSELMRWVHPTLVANTQGTGMGGMTSMRSLYIDTLLGESRANDILQEALPNVVAAHVVQSYVGSYGAMVHPVAACATAAVSVEEGVDKIRLGKAQLVVAGGFDDLSTEGIIGFG